MKKVLTTLFAPNNQISWNETQNGITYVGTLTLLTFSVSGQNTIAYYKGTLTAIN